MKKSMYKMSVLLLMLMAFTACTSKYSLQDLVKNEDKAWDLFQGCVSLSAKQAINDDNCSTAVMALAMMHGGFGVEPGDDLQESIKNFRDVIKGKKAEAKRESRKHKMVWE